MTKLTSTITNLYQKIRSKQIPDTSILLLISLGLVILFHQLMLKKFDDWITEPILSTIKSDFFSDCLWIAVFIATVICVVNIQTRRFFYSKYSFWLGTSFAGIYLYFRFCSGRYSFINFSVGTETAYADVFALSILIFALTYYPKNKKKPEETSDAELKQVQRMIHSYLDMDTNYALLLNGRRGTGKTHFVKNRLLDQIGRTKLDSTTTETYIPIYISLYGLKSIEEIYSQLSMTLKPHLKEDTVASDSYLAKIMLRGMLNITRAGNIDDYIKDFQKGRRNSINVGNFVMIFDDLDRISKELTIGELIGFINNMVEHENNKVIIVADEDEVEDQPLYKEVREKTIGSVVEYPNNFQTAFDEIISAKYSIAAPEFHEHLKKVKPIIDNHFKIGNCVSLRTLLYFLNHYRKVFESLDNKPEEGLREKEIQQRKTNLTLKFACAISIDFKNGTLAYHKTKGIDDTNSINTKLNGNFAKQMFRNNKARLDGKELDNLPLEEMEYPEQFVTKYFDTWEYRYLKSVYDFITGGNELDKSLLISELQFIEEAMVAPTPAQTVYNQLSEPQVFDLSNESYKMLCEKMHKHAVQGQYPLDRYLNIFEYLLRFPEIAQYKSNILVHQLIDGLKTNQSRFSYDSKLDFSLRIENESSKHSERNLLKEALREVNNATEALKEERRTENLYGLFLSAPDQFYELCRREFYNHPVFHSWDFPTFYEDFLKLKPAAIREFTWFIGTRYKYLDTETWIEKHFLEELLNKLSIHSDEEVTFDKLAKEELKLTLHEIHTSYTRTSLNQA